MSVFTRLPSKQALVPGTKAKLADGSAFRAESRVLIRSFTLIKGSKTGLEKHDVAGSSDRRVTGLRSDILLFP